MKIGKVPVDVLREIIIGKINTRRPEVLVGSAVGEDCAVLDFKDQLCVISTDPITGAVAEIGSLAIHIACNDIASNGAEPVAVMMTVLAPEGTTSEDFAQIMDDAGTAASQNNVEIMGGHTEITDVVNRIVISTVALGKHSRENMVTTSGAKVGDAVLMTKSAGLEGTAILAHDKEETLRGMIDASVIERAKSFKTSISVVPEGMVAGKIGVNSMHDATEGGILGAVWELAEASDKGVLLNLDSIPVLPETAAICEAFGIDPYRLISSGVMVMTLDPDKVTRLGAALDEKDIPWSLIGTITEKDRLIETGGAITTLEAPDVDELYRAL